MKHYGGHKLQNSFLPSSPRDRIYQKKLAVESKLNSNYNKTNRVSTEGQSNFISGKND